ncbi:MAG: hypothetical protein WCP21_17235 [Armatimonadota bacterium]
MTDKTKTPIDVRPAGAPPASMPLADSSDTPLTGRQKAWLATQVVLKRLRFIVVLLGVGMFIGYWDTVKNYWDKWTQPRGAVAHELEAGPPMKWWISSSRCGSSGCGAAGG